MVPMLFRDKLQKSQRTISLPLCTGRLACSAVITSRSPEPAGKSVKLLLGYIKVCRTTKHCGFWRDTKFPHLTNSESLSSFTKNVYGLGSASQEPLREVANWRVKITNSRSATCYHKFGRLIYLSSPKVTLEPCPLCA